MTDRNDRPPSTRPVTTLSPQPLDPYYPPPQAQHHGHHLADSHDGGAPLTTTTSHSHSHASPVPDASVQPPQPAPTHPPFSSFFTLVSNTSTRTTHHPRVHYIFSDDEPDALDQAIAHQHQHAQARALHPADDTSAVFPPTDRAVVLDLVPSADGKSWEVGWSSSLSPDWAVLGSRLSRMEEGHHHHHRHRQSGGGRRHVKSRDGDKDTDGHDDDDDGSEGERALMLEIEGIERERPNTVPSASALRPPTATGDDRGGGSSELRSSSSSGGAGREDPAVLVEEFKKKMGLIRKVVHAGEERQARMEQEAQRLAALEREEEEAAAAAEAAAQHQQQQ